MLPTLAVKIIEWLKWKVDNVEFSFEIFFQPFFLPRFHFLVFCGFDSTAGCLTALCILKKLSAGLRWGEVLGFEEMWWRLKLQMKGFFNNFTDSLIEFRVAIPLYLRSFNRFIPFFDWSSNVKVYRLNIFSSGNDMHGWIVWEFCRGTKLN